MKIAIDIILLAILLHGAWSGYKKGLIMGIGGILCIIVSIYGANLLANTFSFDVVPALKPFAGGFMEGRIDAEGGVLDDMGWGDLNYSVEDLLAIHPEDKDKFAAACYENIGIDSRSAAVMAESALDYAETSGDGVVDAVIHQLCASVSYVGCFTLAFLMILIILTVIGNLPNLSYKIPHLDIVNDILGTLLGLANSALLCVVLVWALKFLGIIIGSDTLGETILGSWFSEKDFLFPYLGI